MASTDARESASGPMDAGVGGPTRASIGVRTLRSDRWWLAPLTTVFVHVLMRRAMHRCLKNMARSLDAPAAAAPGAR